MKTASSLIPLLLIVGVFYLLLVRPQQKRVRAHQQLVSSIEPGDEVVTIGGLIGRVVSIDDLQVSVEIAPSTVVRMSRQAVSSKVSEPEPEPVSEPEPEPEGNSSTES
jgi:preprotein translocase subunit YajC